MSPRRYDRRLRLAAADEARRRIVEAAAELHSKHGGHATSHAMIARKAGVSIPTVYKYFPSGNDLIPACTGLIAGRAPLQLDDRLFDAAPRVPERIRLLARSLFRLHEYFAPWLRFGAADAAAFPALRSFFEQGHQGQLKLIRRALSPGGRGAPAESLVLLVQVLLDYPTWKTLTAAGKTTDQAAAVVADAIVHLVRSKRH